jgi:ABC-2 type transport system permease protein
MNTFETAASPSLSRIYSLEAWSEFLKVLRMPAYSIPTLLFPVMFYLMFGVVFGGGRPVLGSVSMATYLLATYGAFGVIGAALFGFGVGVAIERGQGWLQLMRASPMPPGAFFFAKTVMALFFGLTIVLLLSALAIGFGGVDLSFPRWLALCGTLMAGAIPFCAFGLALGFLVGPNAAPAVVNLIYLPMAFFSGLWIPIQVLPEALKGFAQFLPPYHYAQLALKHLDASRGQPAALHFGYLAVFTVLCLAVATWAYRRDSGKTYG